MAKLLATDLDGTLLLPDATVSPRVAKALQAAQDAGIEIVVLTARSWRSLRVFAEEAIPRGVAICSNGAVVYDLERDEIVQAQSIDAEVLRTFVERLEATVDVAIAWETPTEAFRTHRYHELAGGDARVPDAYRAGLRFADTFGADHSVTKLLVRHPSMSAEELLTVLEPITDIVSATISGGTFVEIMAPGVTKALALAALCDTRGIAATDVVAVGDHTNDLPMLRWAGRGVAMANAHPLVLTEIPERTASNVDDGLALVIEDLLR